MVSNWVEDGEEPIAAQGKKNVVKEWKQDELAKTLKLKRALCSRDVLCEDMLDHRQTYGVFVECELQSHIHKHQVEK